MKDCKVMVLYGGVGAEREVSLRSGAALLEALDGLYPTEAFLLDHPSLPRSLTKEEGIVFPALHGEFGEDGKIQKLLENSGFEYVGSDSITSAICMDKVKSKEQIQPAGLQTPSHFVFGPEDTVDPHAIIEQLGSHLVMKPVDSGSSTHLFILHGMDELVRTLDRLPSRNWMVEPYVDGREISIGVLNGIGLGVVEIVPEGGVYDYRHKYTSGLTEYRYPAVLDPEVESRIRSDAETVFAVCGCRDFARVDFRLADGIPWFLEVNTIPGLTAESLFPKSAHCRGMDFQDLVGEIVRPALNRFQRRRS